jgi:hypothetical protein
VVITTFVRPATFREWAAIPHARSRTWRRLLTEALDFVGDL